jgi:ribose transport system permease protein
MKKILQDRVFSLFFTIVIITIVASLVFPGSFLTWGNFSQVLLNVSIDTIVAAGMMLLMISGGFDLSVGSVAAFTGGLAAYMMYYHHTAVPVSIAIALVAAVFIGFINGYLVAYQKINPLIQTLATMGIVRGLDIMVAGAGLQNLPYWFNAIGQSKLLGLQMPIWYMLAIVILMTFLFNKRSFFRRYYFIGGNEKAAELSGIEVNKMKMYAFMITALLAGIAGILLTSRIGAAMSSFGRGMELRVITAVILGGASLNGGAGKIPGAFFGSLFMGLVANIMIIARVSGYWQDIILGLILIIAVWIDLKVKKK